MNHTTDSVRWNCVQVEVHLRNHAHLTIVVGGEAVHLKVSGNTSEEVAIDLESGVEIRSRNPWHLLKQQLIPSLCLCPAHSLLCISHRLIILLKIVYYLCIVQIKDVAVKVQLIQIVNDQHPAIRIPVKPSSPAIQIMLSTPLTT